MSQSYGLLTRREELASKDNGELAEFIYRNFKHDRCNVCQFKNRDMCSKSNKNCIAGIERYFNQTVSKVIRS